MYAYLMLISSAIPFLILLDYYKKRRLLNSVVYIVCFFSAFWLIAFLIDELGLALVYFLPLIPILLFSVLFIKNRK